MTPALSADRQAQVQSPSLIRGAFFIPPFACAEASAKEHGEPIPIYREGD